MLNLSLAGCKMQFINQLTAWLINNGWHIAFISYCFLAAGTFVPVFLAIIRKVELKSGGSSYDDSPFFSEEQKTRLNQHYSRIQGTLGYWKNRAAKHYRFHLYTIIWTTAISITIPILVQTLGENASSKPLLTIVSIHSALLIGFHNVFKVERNYQSFRTAESEFYDLRRSFLDNAFKNQSNMDNAIDEFFDAVSKLRIMARKEEIDNSPSLKVEK